MPKEFNEVQSDEEQVRLETQRFLANFSPEHDVTRAVKALAAVKVKSLEEILKSLESGIVPEHDVEKTFETSVEAAQDYYRTLMRSPGEGSGLMNLDDKAQFLLSLPERLDRAYVRAFDSLYGRFVRFEGGLSSAEKEGKIFSEREQTNLAYFDCMSLLSKVTKKSKRQMLAKEKIDHLMRYNEKRDEIELLKGQIDERNQEYHYLALNGSDIRALKAMRRKVQNGYLFRGTLIDACAKAGYVEGLEDLKRMEEDITYVIEHFDEVEKLRRSIVDDHHQLQHYQAMAKEMDFNNLNSADIKKLVTIENKAAGLENAYKSASHKDTIFIRNILSELRSTASSLLERSRHAIASDQIKIRGVLESLEHAFINGQSISPNQVIDISSQLLSLGLKLEHQRSRKLYEHVVKNRSEDELADYWNNKYPLSDTIVYVAKKDKIKYDVRKFIFADDAILKKLIEKEGLIGKSFDDTAYRCMNWVQQHIEYTPDVEQTGYLEDWLFPPETFQKGKGDCEDGTNLMVSLMRNSGIPAFRVKNACGFVSYEDPITKLKTSGGHSWPVYLRESDNEWAILDWCFLPSKQKVEKRPLAKAQKEYAEIFFTFNDEHSWAQHSFDLRAGYLPRKETVKMITLQSQEPDQAYRAVELNLPPLFDAGSFSLPCFIERIGTPYSTSLFRVEQILGSIRGNWYDKFNSFCQHMQSQPPTKHAEDLEYMKKVRYGLTEAVKSRIVQNDLTKNPESQNLINHMFQSVNDYLSRSEEVCTH